MLSISDPETTDFQLLIWGYAITGPGMLDWTALLCEGNAPWSDERWQDRDQAYLDSIFISGPDGRVETPAVWALPAAREVERTAA